MTTNYPTSLQSIPNPTSTDLLENATATLDHDYQHGTVNDTVAALQAKVGINSSAVTTSHDYKLGEVTGTDKSVGKTATQTLTNKTLTAPQINMGTDATGDMYYRSSGAAFSRLPIGTTGQIIQTSSTGIPEWIANPAAADATYAVKGVKVLDANTVYYAADASGSSTAYTATMSPAPSAYVAGQNYRVKFINANTTTTPTLNLNGLGAKTIVKLVSTALAVGDISANMVCDLHYDGTNFVLLSPTTVTYPYFSIASANVKQSANTERTTTSTTPVLLKKFQVPLAGTITVYSDIHSTSSFGITATIYINGVSAGQLGNTISNTYVTINSNYYVSAGGIIEIYLQTSNVSGTGYISNSKIAYDLGSLTTAPVVITD